VDAVDGTAVPLTETDGVTGSVVLGVVDVGALVVVVEGLLTAERSGVDVRGVAGAVDAWDDVWPVCGAPLVRAPIVVIPDVCDAPTKAETGRCPMSSIPVTMPIATRKTTAALRPVRDHGSLRGRVGDRRGSTSRGRLPPLPNPRGRRFVACRGPESWVRDWTSR
jgi:hypothetical protein